MTTKQLEFFTRRREKHNEIMELRRKIRATLRSSSNPMSLEQITQALYQEDRTKIQTQLYTLSRMPSSDLWHNGLRGPGSRYSLGVKLIG